MGKTRAGQAFMRGECVSMTFCGRPIECHQDMSEAEFLRYGRSGVSAVDLQLYLSFLCCVLHQFCGDGGGGGGPESTEKANITTTRLHVCTPQPPPSKRFTCCWRSQMAV